MASHRVFLGKVKFRGRVGNSKSTFHTWIPENSEYTIFWKDESKKFTTFSNGDVINIRCDGKFPSVTKMIVPIEQVARIAWEKGFYAKNRFPSLEQMVKMIPDSGTTTSKYTTYYCKSCGVTYRDSTKPWGWWASEKCSSQEFEGLLRFVFTF